MTRDDLLFVVLIGHGTFDGADAKFNLVGPDLESAEWAALLAGLPGRVVVVNTTSASFPFLERLAGARRVVITATDSAAQRFDTVFPEYFIRALRSDAADIDKNGRDLDLGGVRRGDRRACAATTSSAASSRPSARCSTTTATASARSRRDGDDGSLSSHDLSRRAAARRAPTDEVLLKLLQKRAALETDIDELKVRRSFLRAGGVSDGVRAADGRARAGQQDIRARVKS